MDDPAECFLDCKTDSFSVVLEIGGVVIILLGFLALASRFINPGTA